ncbi:dihydrofolate reductase family protein [Kribbella sp. CA-247076]|uniref:dihydrofolate reductase family protein n=1 Tax=Kribbella sp. CA-247076 TaxID=3239941 RepID=UPI003D8A1858
MTGSVVWHMTMSLDGYIAGPGDTLDWYSVSSGPPSELGDEVAQAAGAFLTGGRLITEDFDFDNSRPYGDDWHGRTFIYTHKDPATAPHPDLTYLSGDIREVVATALAGADGKNLTVSGGTVPGLCLDAGLVDEVVLHYLPVLLGDGIPFYRSPGAAYSELELVRGDGLNLRFRVKK